ncbi:MAG: hypothetical protein P1U56_02570 [Saprospiraceae bacterium]|nr:hypothetical protein [Saprospiraceae bacterium]
MPIDTEKIVKKIYKIYNVDISYNAESGIRVESIIDLYKILVSHNVKCMIVEADLELVGDVTAILIDDLGEYYISYKNGNTVMLYSISTNKEVELNLSLKNKFIPVKILVEDIDRTTLVSSNDFGTKYSFLPDNILKFSLAIIIILLLVCSYFQGTLFLQIFAICSLLPILLFFRSRNNDRSLNIINKICGEKDSCDDILESNIYGLDLKIMAVASSIFWCLYSLLCFPIANIAGIIIVVTSFFIVGLSLFFQLFIYKEFCRICLIIAAFTVIINTYVLYDIGIVDYAILNNLGILNVMFFMAMSYVFAFQIVSKENNEQKMKEYNIQQFYTWTNFGNVMNISSPMEQADLNETDDQISVKIFLNLGCKHCKELLLHMLNALNITDSMKLEVFVNFKETKKNNRYYAQLCKAIEERNFKDSYEIFSTWSEDKDILQNGNEFIIRKDVHFKNLKGISEFTRGYFPVLIINNRLVPSYINPNFIKIALNNTYE